MLVSIRNREWAEWAMWWMYGVVVFGVASAIQYFFKFWNGVDERTKLRRRRELLALEKREKRRRKAASMGEKVRTAAVDG
jgi:hypothetical protein